MITPKDFLKERLFEIFNKVKTINIRYQYSEYDDTHLVEVTPPSEYAENDLYLRYERDLLFEFNDKFFPATILFLTEGSLCEITSADMVFKREVQEFYSNQIKRQPIWNLNDPMLTENKVTAGENNYALAA